MYLTIEASAHADLMRDLGSSLNSLVSLLPLLPNGPARMVARKAMARIGDVLVRLDHLPTIDPPSLN